MKALSQLRFYLALCLAPLLALISWPSSAAITGADIYTQTIEKTPIYNDKALQQYVERLGNEVVAVSEMSGEKFIFTLLDDEGLNAFATRDNYIYVNRGLLNYVSNEAQLVAVLAHEVGHITREHVTGQESRMTGAKILSTLAGALSNSSEVYEATMAYMNSMMKSHGRRNELEADETGAEYMAKLGYDPKAMLSMLGIMKDYESVQKKQAKGRGAVRPTYHGVFASHPRNDARLRTVVVKADALKSNLNKGDGAETYRQLTDGLVWGVNFLAKTAPPNRYSNMDLKVRIDFPTNWSVNSAIEDGLATAEAPDKVASMTLKRARRTAQAPEEYLFNYMKIQQLNDGQAISPAGLSGYTGLLPATAEKPSQRIAVIYYKLDAYIISADVTDSDQHDDLDQAMLSAIRTFRPISRAEIAGQKPKIVKYLQIESSTTYAELIKTYKLNASDEEILRVINGHYPVGEPEVGQWIKVFQQ